MSAIGAGVNGKLDQRYKLRRCVNLKIKLYASMK